MPGGPFSRPPKGVASRSICFCARGGQNWQKKEKKTEPVLYPSKTRAPFGGAYKKKGLMEATDRPKPRKRPREDEAEEKESSHFSFRFQDGIKTWCFPCGRIRGLLLNYQCASFAILKPKNRKTGKREKGKAGKIERRQGRRTLSCADHHVTVPGVVCVAAAAFFCSSSAEKKLWPSVLHS